MSPRATATTAVAPPTPDEPVVPWHNTVVLCGRLTALPEPVELPSGDALWRFRVAVERVPSRAARKSAATPARRVVDAVDCSTASARVAARLSKLSVGAVVEVHGALTRRFWRGPAGPASRYEVTVDQTAPVR